MKNPKLHNVKPITNYCIYSRHGMQGLEFVKTDKSYHTSEEGPASIPALSWRSIASPPGTDTVEPEP